MLSLLGIKSPRHKNKHKHKKNKHVRYSCAHTYAYVAVIPSEDNIGKKSVFVLLRANVYAYAYALVKTSFMTQL